MEENPNSLSVNPESSGKFNGIKILVAEDEDSSFKVIDRILNEYGVDTLRAVNGREAVELVSNSPGIRLIFMDIKMPVMNGIQATRTIKKHNPGLPIIATTAFAMPGDQQVFKEAGCDDYLSKPIKEEKIINLLTKFIS